MFAHEFNPRPSKPSHAEFFQPMLHRDKQYNVPVTETAQRDHKFVNTICRWECFAADEIGMYNV